MIQGLSTVIIIRPSGVLHNVLNARKIERKQGFGPAKYSMLLTRCCMCFSESLDCCTNHVSDSSSGNLNTCITVEMLMQTEGIAE